MSARLVIYTLGKNTGAGCHFPTPEGEISITSDNVDDTTPVAESEEELKSLLMKVKEESEKKPGLKLNIKKTKIMGSGAII